MTQKTIPDRQVDRKDRRDRCDSTGAQHSSSPEAQIPDPRIRYFRKKDFAYVCCPGQGKALLSVMVRDRVELAADPQCPQTFMMLLSNDDTAVQEALAGNPQLTLQVMRYLAHASGSPALVLARRPDAPPEVLRILAAVAWRRKQQSWWCRPDVHEEILKVVLALHDCPTWVLARHARRDSLSQQLVAGNLSCPERSLDHWAANGDREALARWPPPPRPPRPPR